MYKEMNPSKTNDDELNAIQNINKVIHEPARLLLMAHLFVVESADFLFLQRQTELTWGNISSHLRKLENAGYVAVEKEFIDKKPHTTLKLTDKGRKAFQEYRKNMKQVFEDLPE
jgi:DNA-binding MarR family transcriptional regulator